MREPFDKVWYLTENKATEGIIYFVECYIKSEKNPVNFKIGFYTLGHEIETKYYIISEYDFNNTSPIGLKERAEVRSEDEIFDTRRELADSIMED